MLKESFSLNPFKDFYNAVITVCLVNPLLQSLKLSGEDGGFFNKRVVNSMSNDDASPFHKEEPVNPIFAAIDFISRFKYAAVIIPVAGILSVAFPYISYMAAKNKLTSCRGNMVRIGTALEMYSTDNSGHYPDRLKDLAPVYLADIPACPSAETDTYSAGYQGRCNPDYYTYCCKGKNHTAAFIQENYPGSESSGWAILHTTDNPYMEINKSGVFRKLKLSIVFDGRLEARIHIRIRELILFPPCYNTNDWVAGGLCHWRSYKLTGETKGFAFSSGRNAACTGFCLDLALTECQCGCSPYLLDLYGYPSK